MARTGRPASTFSVVPTADIGGVTVTFAKHMIDANYSCRPAKIIVADHHTLSVQAEQLASITGRIGRRLNQWLRTNPDGIPPP